MRDQPSIQILRHFSGAKIIKIERSGDRTQFSSPFLRLSRFVCLVLAVLMATVLLTAPGTAAKRSGAKSDEVKHADSGVETRRAFVVGVHNYDKNGLQELFLPVKDAEDIKASLQQVGFDEKNVKISRDAANKDAFLSEFKKFLDTVNEGDDVVFYFSGLGVGGRTPDGQSLNYLLFGDATSPLKFAQSKASDSEKKQAAAVAALAAKYLPDYETTEIPSHGVSEKDIIARIQEKKPHVAIIVFDACRTLLPKSVKGEIKVRTIKPESEEEIPQGFLVMYSASFGQNAIEGGHENSLFAAMFRKFIATPGQDLEHLAKRVKEAVTQAALDMGETQEPYYIRKLRQGDFSFVGSIGSEKFQLDVNPCDYAEEHWKEIKRNPSRDQLEFHLKQFAGCKTKREVEQALEDLNHGATLAVSSEGDDGNIDPCDKFAASEEDRDRPSNVPGVNFGKIDPVAAIPACTEAATNPAVVRYLFNLGRAYNRKAQKTQDGDPDKKKAQTNAFLSYTDAVERGYLPAFVDLALMYDKGEGVSAPDKAKATQLLQRAADQGYPLAMYQLAIRYRKGEGGLPQNSPQAYEWYAKAAEAGNISAMVESGWYLCQRQDPDPLRAVYWLTKAANTPNSGADGAIAKRALGILYYRGCYSTSKEADALPRDYAQAVLWFAQAAEDNDTVGQFNLALMLEQGMGLSTQQPQLAERYWRLAAYRGDVDAKVDFAERILSNRVLLKPENGPDEVVTLLDEAVKLGSSRAALRLAKIYRTGEFHHEKQPEKAIKYAYKAISLAQAQVAGNASVQGSQNDNPLDEIAAGILLAEMAANGEAVDANGKALIEPEELNRLELYYGRPDPDTRKVKVRSLKVLMKCGRFDDERVGYTVDYIWVWDWGREESPTEMQFRNYESKPPFCAPREKATRATLNSMWKLVHDDKDNRFAFADLVASQADAASQPTK
jgi:TPR repeat protein